MPIEEKASVRPDTGSDKSPAGDAAVYAFFAADCLVLKDSDRAALRRAFGLSDAEIDALQFRTVPGRIWLIVIEYELQKRFGEDLADVPGFYQSGPFWRVNLRPDGGLLKPHFDRAGRITRLRVMPHLRHDGYFLASPDTGARLQRESEVMPRAA
jgi:hypothetical protein